MCWPWKEPVQTPICLSLPPSPFPPSTPSAVWAEAYIWKLLSDISDGQVLIPACEVCVNLRLSLPPFNTLWFCSTWLRDDKEQVAVKGSPPSCSPFLLLFFVRHQAGKACESSHAYSREHEYRWILAVCRVELEKPTSSCLGTKGFPRFCEHALVCWVQINAEVYQSKQWKEASVGPRESSSLLSDDHRCQWKPIWRAPAEIFTDEASY